MRLHSAVYTLQHKHHDVHSVFSLPTTGRTRLARIWWKCGTYAISLHVWLLAAVFSVNNDLYLDRSRIHRYLDEIWAKFAAPFRSNFIHFCNRLEQGADYWLHDNLKKDFFPHSTGIRWMRAKNGSSGSRYVVAAWPRNWTDLTHNVLIFEHFFRWFPFLCAIMDGRLRI